MRRTTSFHRGRRVSVALAFATILLAGAMTPARAVTGVDIPPLPTPTPSLPSGLPSVTPSVSALPTVPAVPVNGGQVPGILGDGGTSGTSGTGGGSGDGGGSGGSGIGGTGPSGGAGSAGNGRSGGAIGDPSGTGSARQGGTGAKAHGPLSSYGTLAGRGLFSAGQRALRLAAPFAPPVVLALLVFMLIAGVSRGSDKLVKVENVTSKRTFKL